MPLEDQKQCTALTREGSRCKNRAASDSGICALHSRLMKFGRTIDFIKDVPVPIFESAAEHEQTIVTERRESGTIYADEPVDPVRILAQIELNSKFARASWITLIVFSLYSLIVLYNSKDAAFYEYASDVKLPIVGANVSVHSFLYSASIIALGIFVYIQLKAIRIFAGIATLHRHTKVILSEALYPWLVTDWALIRNHIDSRSSAENLALSVTVLFLFFGIAPALLFVLWVKSFPSHDEVLALLIGFLFLISIFYAHFTLRCAKIDIDSPPDPNISRRQTRTYLIRSGFATLALCVTCLGWLKTEGGFEYVAEFVIDFVEEDIGIDLFSGSDDKRSWIEDHILTTDDLIALPGSYPAAVDLTNAQIVRIPEGWQKRSAWLDSRIKSFRKERSLGPPDRLPKDFWEEADQARDAFLFDKVGSPVAINLDMRNADLRGAFLVGANLDNARFDRSDLHGAEIEGATFIGTSFKQARLVGLDFSPIYCELTQKFNGHCDYTNKLIGADFRGAHLDAANLSGNTLVNVNFEGADLTGVDFYDAQLLSVDLSGAELRGNSFNRAIISYAVTARDAYFYNVNFLDARVDEQVMKRMLRTSVVNEGTLLPFGLVGNKCWKSPPRKPRFQVLSIIVWVRPHCCVTRTRGFLAKGEAGRCSILAPRR